MGQFKVFNSFPEEFTFISNSFLDFYMPSANGEFVKIYLYLLRHASGKGTTLDLSSIADAFNCTEADIQRALRYWKNCGILNTVFDGNGNLKEIIFYSPKEKPDSINETAVTAEKTISSDFALTPDKIRELKNNSEVRQLLFIAEQYLGKSLSPTDMQTLLYLYDEVKLSSDLLEYLIEYCVSKGSTSMAYIKKVGLAWAEQNITTVTEAKEETNLYNKNYFTILRAFGIKNRNPLDKEIQYMNLWLNQYGFTLEIISEACNRTVLATGKASFSYADSILESWFKKGVHHPSDIDALDQSFQQKKASRTATSRSQPAPSKNKFNNFHQRNYNMAELEKQLLNK